jgi:hypothetical protein
MEKVALVFSHILFCSKEDLTHKFWKICKILITFGNSLFNILVDVPEITFKIIKSNETIVD